MSMLPLYLPQVNPLRVKKLHVLAALEVDKFKKKTLDLNPAMTQHTAGGRTMQPTATMQNTAAQTLNSKLRWTCQLGAVKVRLWCCPTIADAQGGEDNACLMTLDAVSNSAGPGGIDNAWRGAEAYHFWLLAHRQLYAASGGACICVWVVEGEKGG
eukprot:1158916-Pelagomonas_calceolata.AAC.5